MMNTLTFYRKMANSNIEIMKQYKSATINKMSYDEILNIYVQHNINFDKLSSQSIIDAWNNDQINAIRELHLKGEYYKNNVCNECVLSTANVDDNT